MTKRKPIQWRKSDVRKLLMVFLGALLTAIGLNIFVASKDLLPSGFTGVATLAVRVGKEFFNVNLSFSVIYLVLNFIPAVFVYNYIGRKFTIFSIIHVILVSVFTLVIPEIQVTNDTLLVCVFGGIFQGVGTLLSLKANACSGGTDFIAMYVSQRYNRSVWNYVLVLNCILLITSGALFDVEPALYSIIYQFTNTQIVNTFHDRYHLRALTIITKQPDLVAQEIFKITRRGITEWDAKGKYNQTAQNVLYLVVSADEANRIVKVAKNTDENAFITDVKVQRVVGNFYQKPFE